VLGWETKAILFAVRQNICLESQIRLWQVYLPYCARYKFYFCVR